MPELTKENVKEMIGESDMEWEFFVAFVKEPENEIVHIIGYLEPPLVCDITSAIEELKTSEEFGQPADLVDILRLRIFQFAD